MADFKKIFASILLILGTIGSSLVVPAATEQDVSQSIENVIDQLSKSFTKLIKFDLNPEENAVFSPLNIYTAMALLSLGTSGQTRTEISTALEMPLDNAGFATYDRLSVILKDVQTTNAADVKIANMVLVQKGWKVKESYSRAVKQHYKTEVQQVDFDRESSQITDMVNKWASNVTKDRIPKLFQNEIPSDSRLLLANVLFFNASWVQPFDANKTYTAKFNTSVQEVEVPMMNLKGYIPYVNDEALQVEVIRLPYQEGDFHMVIMLPYRNYSLGSFIDEFKLSYRQQKIRQFPWKTTPVDCRIPRFKFSWSRSINNLIASLGLDRLFSNPELNDMVENSQNLRVSGINHAAGIQVDEGGTTATAATNFEVSLRRAGTLHPPTVIFQVDRPFLFSIYHYKTGVILFTGIVQNPLV